MPHFAQKAFTLVELMIVVAILGTVITLAVPAVTSARTNAVIAQGDAVRTQLNYYAQDIRDKGQSSPGTTNSDKVAALANYYALGYIDRPISIENVAFRSGVWVLDPH